MGVHKPLFCPKIWQLKQVSSTGGGGVTTSSGEDGSTTAKAQLGDEARFDWSPVESVFALACVKINMNNPSAITSIASKPKRFKEKNRIEPPRI
jgi:hypothetical protein